MLIIIRCNQIYFLSTTSVLNLRDSHHQYSRLNKVHNSYDDVHCRVYQRCKALFCMTSVCNFSTHCCFPQIQHGICIVHNILKLTCFSVWRTISNWLRLKSLKKHRTQLRAYTLVLFITLKHEVTVRDLLKSVYWGLRTMHGPDTCS